MASNTLPPGAGMLPYIFEDALICDGHETIPLSDETIILLEYKVYSHVEKLSFHLF